eukprot:GSMAST32.ASY1.ANO1.1120.1 assembled CDS
MPEDHSPSGILRPTLIRQQSILSPSNHRQLLRAELGDGSGGVFYSVCVFVQSIVGGGLLTYPCTFANSGIGNVMVIQSIVVLFVAKGLIILAECTERACADTYQALMLKLLGRKAEIFCEVILVVLIFGASVVYLDVCVDQVHPWLLLREIAALRLPAIVGFVSLFYVMIVIVINYSYSNDRKSTPCAYVFIMNFLPISNFFSYEILYLTFFFEIFFHDTLCFSYQGHISAVPLYAELKTRTTFRWHVIVFIGLFVCILIYNISGFFGYLTFLKNTKPDILTNFDFSENRNVGKIVIIFARVAVALAVMTTFAVFHFCARSAILNEIEIFHYVKQHSNIVFVTVTGIWCILVALVSMYIPNIDKMIQIVGNFASFFMYQFPGAMIISCVIEDSKTQIFHDVEKNDGGDDDEFIGQSSHDVENTNIHKEYLGIRYARFFYRCRCWFGRLGPQHKYNVVVGVVFILFGFLIFTCGLISAFV